MTIIDNSLETSKGIELVQIGVGIFLIILAFWTNFSFPAGAMFFDLGAVVGIVCIGFGIYRHSMNKESEKYLKLIKNKSIMSFAEIAKAMNDDEATVEKILTWMMNNDFFVNTKINYKDKYIFDKNVMMPLKNVSNVTVSTHIPKEKKQQQEYHAIEKEYISAVCDHCGGATMIEIGKGGICDYCRAPLGNIRNTYMKERSNNEME